MKTRSRTSLFLAVTALLGLGVCMTLPTMWAENSVPAQVSVKGLRLVDKPYNGEDSMRPFNWFAGTAMAVQVDVPAGGLIELDRASELSAMTDDKGTNLIDRAEGRGITGGIGGLPMISSDGRAALIEITGPGTPAAGAKFIRAKGTLVFKQATTKTTFKDVVVLQKRSTADSGPIPLTITKVGKPEWGSEPLGVTFRANQDTSAIADIRFFDVKGSPIEVRQAGTTRMGTPERMTVDISFALTRKVDVVNMEIDYWKDLRQLVVPFDIRASVGLGE